MGYSAAAEDRITYRMARLGATKDQICVRLNVPIGYFETYLDKHYKRGRQWFECKQKQEQLQRLP